MSTEAQRNAANGSGNMFTMSADLSEITPVAPIARNGYAPFAKSTPNTLVSQSPIVTNTSQTVDALRYPGVYVDGVRDSTAGLQAACDDADVIGAIVILPACPLVISRTLIGNRLRGVPGWTRFIPAAGFVYATDKGFVANRHFIASYNPNGNPPDYVEYTNITIDWTPDQRNDNGYIRLANVKGGLIENNYFAASKVLGGDGKPYVVGAFVDLWGPCKNVIVRQNVMRMMTGAYGATRIAPGGGLCVGIRCLQFATTDVALDERATENNVVEDNDIVHWSTDEAIAIYGVKGITRYNTVSRNKIYSPKSDTSSTDPYHVTLISVFPLNDGSAPGAKAACYGNRIFANKILDYSCFSSVVRTGNDTDANNPCYNNVSENNEITLYLSKDATNGQHAVWVTLGSVGVDPAIGLYAYRVITGNASTGYPGFWDGNTSLNDRVLGVNTPYVGWLGHCYAENPMADGASIGCMSVQDVNGGQLHVATIPFFNCQRANSTRVRVDVANGPLINIDQTASYRYSFKNIQSASSSRLLNLTANVPASAMVVVQGCSGSLGTIEAAVTNNANAGARVVVQDNEFAGTITAASSGTGTTISRRNYWGGLID